jgi:phenylacetate-CoA ligase
MSNKKDIGWIFRNYLFNPYRTQAIQSIKRSQSWSKDEIIDYQTRQLKNLLTHAYETVPFYKNSFSQAGFSPDMFKSIEDIKKVPILTKDDIRTYRESLISTTFPKKFIISDASGGTTGLPVPFYADVRTFSTVEWVYIKSLWQRVGYRFRDKYVVFRGEVVNANPGTAKSYWKFDKLRNCVIFSSFEMGEEQIPIYINKIKEFKPKFIHSYPSVLLILAQYILNHKITDFPPLKAIFVGSETLFPWQRELFETVFNTRIYTWYGHRERCILAGEQTEPSVYEAFPSYGFTELLNDQKIECSAEGEEGELVGTGFYNYAFPLIRYNTLDIAENCNRQTSPTNFKRIKNIKGRIQDFFVDKQGSLITFSTSYKALIPIMDKIAAHQFIQESPGELMLNIEPRNELTEDDILEVRRSFNERFPNFDLKISTVQDIPRTVSGKFRYFIQKMDIAFKNEPVGLVNNLEAQGK